MSYIEAIVLGLVQGLCEFLPVSSSGHLVLFQNLFGLSANASENQLTVVLLHVATLVAVVVAFHRLVWRLICAFGRIVKKWDRINSDFQGEYISLLYPLSFSTKKKDPY